MKVHKFAVHAALSLGVGLLGPSLSAKAEPSSVALVLDASGSMNGKLSGGMPKIDAAKAAVADFVSKVDPGVNLAFRAYGHGSHRSKRNCRDTQLIVDFARAGDNGAAILASAKGLKARGYTPITYVLGLAADDLRPTAGKHVIVLVSDGKETCKGDPCLLAQKLAAADAALTIHTIGFGVDATTERQLRCIAGKGRGKYFAANDISALSNSMSSAVEKADAEASRDPQPKGDGRDAKGKLEIRGADRHAVLDAETGKEVTRISYTKTIDAVPAGLYNVKFDNGLWKSVEVRANETTVLSPAILKIENGTRHDIVDQETGEIVSTVSRTTDGGKAVLIPGRFDIRFEEIYWRDVVLEEGKTTVLKPAGIDIKGAGMSGVAILDTKGKQVAKIRSTRSYAALPPGRYTLVLKDGTRKEIELVEGNTKSISLK